ncbi:HesA/MoeB/ThiF family protein [Larsenimonas rhizosphaerae]|uniref:Molybdopterin-synthase adenylyltransferase n=1 Tax=Larsenimonas rhizosphaerae TaxID=2944682 RepID=A0AA42CU98_9GAMM|nr:molybdopterin-synthase adenylyltransferase MoeB [Larsenimonas rhizosphaerae]MCX2523821.1 molybdopterin-synthase adenylyltransferase MoeB [Larsenimonas rhizosphaerae]
MDDSALLRYSRHIMLPQMDIVGQERLLAAHVVIMGVGGLGSPAALYLAASGIGHLTLVDDDVVDVTNLQRQISHTTSSLGQSKAESARRQALALNPSCHIDALTSRPDETHMRALAVEADVVLDCTDRFTSRYQINRACMAAGTPLVSGAAIRFSGQLAVFDPRDEASPCYACLYGDSTEDDELTCAESGVVAPLVGIIGAFQALEAVKLLSGAGARAGGLSTLDGLSGEWRQFDVPRDPACSTCRDRAGG